MSRSSVPTAAEGAAPPARRRSRWLPAVGWAVSLALLALAFRIIPIREVWEAVRGVSGVGVLLAMLCASLSISLRGWRWASILGLRKRVPVLEASRIAMLGLAINGVVPGRVGDVARVGMAMRWLGARGIPVAASVVIDRLLDAVTLLAFLGVAVGFVGFETGGEPIEILGDTVSSDQLFSLLVSLGAMVAVVLVSLAILGWGVGRAWPARFLARFPVVGTRLRARVAGSVDELGGLLAALRRPRVTASLGMKSFAIWIPLVLGNQAIAAGVSDLSLTFGQVVLVTVVSIAASSLPSAPGAWGVYEAGVFLSLKAAAVPALDTTILAYAFTAHFCQYVPVMCLGALALIVGKRRS